MVNVVAINGSPSMERGQTALMLNAFVEGMQQGGMHVETYHATKLKVQACACGSLRCWNELDGKCCIQDSMQEIYPKLKTANILILATPMYIPLPGDLQNIMNRLVALMMPEIVSRDGRTRARMRDDVNISKIALVAVSGWWEMENMDTLLRIARELAEDASVEFGGALLRPHASYMLSDGEITPAGREVLAAARQAGIELATLGTMNEATLRLVSQPLVPRYP